ncbi:phenylalanine--tRNA ligase subunit beta [Phenylobacterium sp. Root77]|uniref:phenylalanine--tRNA ligase subunit beta n=1 Tax=unclassified Phenylobacterium TaxID=2640670 RepID=UPI0006FA04C9|nr:MULTISPECIES: phenylalanine--tRNA ligase subunit beta [unclassified Phenylobacterium]KQW73245.1 phenylalanine--tRNA ligase subunit beta [Phenylobacterium sp. Root1277]KQW92465.1 phenylalanine--tRNA ligase subunit beta [Phenylobacterium sp. Root1290]KRC40694.1 phenylalanine--tRNA ligase subunit beta [Phenylobacterium sp. Root77]
MKFTLSWLKDHLETDATTAQVVDAMTMAGLEVEHVDDPAAKLAAFSVAKIVEAVQHPNADRLRVCQVDTRDGRKEIVCGAPNARAGITVVYAPIGAYVPGLGVTLVEKPVRGVVSNGMLCSASELETAAESDGIMELPDTLEVGTPVAQALGLEAVIDFEVTPNRPDWLGVVGIARDLAAAGLGKLKDVSVTPVAGKFANPIEIRLDGSDGCRQFTGRLIRGVKNGPSPAWLQQKLTSIGLRPINALVDVTNLISYDRARPLHVYDVSKLAGGFIEARAGKDGESVEALDGKTYAVTPEITVIADGSGAIGLGGVMGGLSTGCSDETTDVFVESAWFDPIRIAQTGRTTGITSDAQYRFARTVDPASQVPGLELATKLILELCGGEPSEVTVVGEAPAAPDAVVFDRSYVKQLSGLDLPVARIDQILTDLGFTLDGDKVQPPSWRRDVEGKADLVEEVARIEGYDALPATALPEMARPAGGVLTARQTRVRVARRAMAAKGYAETITWSFTKRETAALFGGGQPELVITNPIASDLDCMRPSILPNLIEAAGRNARRGFPDVALFEIGPLYRGDQPADQITAISAIVAPHAPRRWDGAAADALFELKADLMSLLEDLGAPTGSLQATQGGLADWWHPGRSAALRLGKNTLVEFGEIHPRILKALDVEGPVLGFELIVDNIPEPKKKSTKTKPALELSSLMPLSRDFAFVVDEAVAAGDLIKAVAGADKALITQARVFDVYRGQGVAEGSKSVAVEILLQPREKTLTDAEIEALSAKVVAAAEKAVSAKLRA